MPKRDPGDLARMLSTKAAGDEAILEKLLEDPEVPDDVLGFHAQQSIEKLLKAVLASRGLAFERTHNIEYLLALLEDHDIEPPPNANELHALTPWATEFRYEDASGTPSIGSASASLRARSGRGPMRRWSPTAKRTASSASVARGRYVRVTSSGARSEPARSR